MTAECFMPEGKQLGEASLSPGRHRGFLERLVDRIFGFDFFICYAWRDGRSYAVGLVELLERDGFDCFLDSKDYFAGDDLVEAGSWALQKTRHLVLVGTPWAPHRPDVLQELKLFAGENRKIIPIDLGGCPRSLPPQHPFLPYLSNTTLRIEAPPSESKTGPSEHVVAEIKRCFDGKRQTQKRLRMGVGLAIIFAVLFVAATFFAVRERIATREAKRQLATSSWLMAQDSRDFSPIKSTHYYLRSAETLSSIGDSAGCRDAVLAAQYDSAILNRTWVQEAPVFGCLFSPDASRIVSWGLNGKVRVLSADGSHPSEVFGHNGPILGASFNANGRKVLSWSADGTTRIWDLSGRSPPDVLRCAGAVNGAAFASKEARVLTWSYDGSASLWDPSMPEPLKVFRHESLINGSNAPATAQMSLGFVRAQAHKGNELCAAALDHEASVLVTAGSDATARLWAATDDTPRFVFRGAGAIRGAQFTSDSKYVVCWGDCDMVWFQTHPNGNREIFQATDTAVLRGTLLERNEKRILSWNKAGTLNLRTFPGGRSLRSFQHGGSVNGAIFLRDARDILSWSDAGTAVLWSTSNGEKMLEFKHDGPVTGAVVNPEETLLLTRCTDGSARLWNLADGMLVRTYTHQGPCNGAIFSPRGTQILTWGEDGVTRLWNLEPTGCYHRYEQEDSSKGACFAADGSRVITWGAGGKVTVWNTNGSYRLCVFEHGQNLSDAMTERHTDNVLTWGSDGIIKLWSPTNNAPSRTYGLSAAVDGVSTSQNDAFILAWSRDGFGVVWSASDGTLANRVTQQGVVGAAFAPLGTAFLTWGLDGIVNVWRAKEPEPVSTCRHEDAVLGAEWNSDANRFITWSLDGTARLWSLNGSKPLASFKHGRAVIGATFGSKGTLVLTWGRDNKAKLWRPGNSEPITVFDHEQPLLGAAFHTDGAGVWTWTSDGVLRFWRGPSPKPARAFHEVGIRAVQLTHDGTHFMTWNASGQAQFWSVERNEPLCILPHGHRLLGALLDPSESRILTWGGGEAAKLWTIDEENRIPIAERSLEIEVRSATTLGSDGQLRVLSVEEWEAKRRALAGMQTQRQK